MGTEGTKQIDWYISYFYHIRNMPPTMIPISTAMWDPGWFHNNKGNDYLFKVKNGVINGIRCNGLNPHAVYVAGEDCPSGGRKECKLWITGDCKFLPKYKEYLESLNFKEVINKLESACRRLNPNCTAICLLVYEAFDNPCSEREPLIEWFNENGKELKLFKG